MIYEIIIPTGTLLNTVEVRRGHLFSVTVLYGFELWNLVIDITRKCSQQQLKIIKKKYSRLYQHRV